MKRSIAALVMTTSLVLAGGESGHTRPRCKDAAEMFAESYCRSIREFANLPILQVARRQIHRQESIRPIHAALRQSQRARPVDLLEKFTENHRGQHRVRDLRPGFWRVRGGKAREVLDSLAAYREFCRRTGGICSICSARLTWALK